MTLDALKQDLHYGLRGLRSKPGFAAAVVVTLALGIGANAAMFGIVDRLLFRPPPMLKDPDTAHRVYLYRVFRGTERPGGVSQYARYRDIATMTTSFSHEAGHSTRQMAVGVGDAAREMQIGIVSASFFTFFDAPTVVGRYFGPSEDQTPSGEPVVVLSYAMWQTQFGGVSTVLDSIVQIGPTKYSVIGVAPPGFVGLWTDRPPVAFIPITNFAAGQNFRPQSLHLVGDLQLGVDGHDRAPQARYFDHGGEHRRDQRAHQELRKAAHRADALAAHQRCQATRDRRIDPLIARA